MDEISNLNLKLYTVIKSEVNMKKLKIVLGAVLFIALMALNVQIGLNDGSTTGANVFFPAAQAQSSDPGHEGGEEHTCYDSWNECTFDCDSVIDCIDCSRVFDVEDPYDQNTCETD